MEFKILLLAKFSSKNISELSFKFSAVAQTVEILSTLKLHYLSVIYIFLPVQWNFDLTKSLGTGQIGSLNGGFVISRFFSIHCTVTLAGT